MYCITGTVILCIIQYNILDINECNTNNGGCDDTCINTIGSYYCQCDTGYSLNSDGHTCNGM